MVVISFRLSANNVISVVSTRLCPPGCSRQPHTSWPCLDLWTWGMKITLKRRTRGMEITIKLKPTLAGCLAGIRHLAKQDQGGQGWGGGWKSILLPGGNRRPTTLAREKRR